MGLHQPNHRERLRQLLSIPESERTNHQWDEIHHLELEVVRQPVQNTAGTGYVQERAGANRPPKDSERKKEITAANPASGPVKRKAASSYLRSRHRNDRSQRPKKD
jgi:hypothetical protein